MSSSRKFPVMVRDLELSLKFISKLALCIALACILFDGTISSVSAREKCWAKEIVLQGTIEMEILRHPNGNESVGYFLRTDAPVCYIGYDQEKMQKIEMMSGPYIQIWEIGKNAATRAYVGKYVEIIGEILEPQGGYARTMLAILDPKFRILDKELSGANRISKSNDVEPNDIEELVFYCIAFLEDGSVLKRMQTLWKADPLEPGVLLLALYGAGGPANDRIKLQPGKVDQIVVLQLSIRQRAPSMSDNALVALYRKCRSIFER